MSGFDPLTITYGEQSKVIDGSMVMRAAAEVENIIPYGGVGIALNPQHFNFALASSAYIVLLRYAGIKFIDREVLQKVTNGEASEDAGKALQNLFNQYQPIEIEEKETKKKQVKRSKKTSG